VNAFMIGFEVPLIYVSVEKEEYQRTNEYNGHDSKDAYARLFA